MVGRACKDPWGVHHQVAEHLGLRSPADRRHRWAAGAGLQGARLEPFLLIFFTFVPIAIVQVPDYNPSPVTEADKATKAKFAKVLR